MPADVSLPDADEARFGHKVRCGRRDIENCRNKPGMSMKTKEARVQDSGFRVQE